MMKKPNFFIIGAPKCGTTSLARWLGEHPKIYMSPIKEPYYFDKDHNYTAVENSLSSYEALFKEASKEHKIIGEASTRYLYSKVAVGNILDYNPEAKFVVCLRNPVEMAYSLHQQEIFSGHENIISFNEAWSLRKRRNIGKGFPEGCKDRTFLQYDKACATGSQCERVLQQVSDENIHFILLDDLKEDSKSVYKSLLNFLDLEYDGRKSFEAHNKSKTYRSEIIQKLRLIVDKTKRKFGLKFNTGIFKWNVKEVKREPLTSKMRLQLEKHFEKEIIKLEKILNRDLSYWFKELNRTEGSKRFL